MMVMNICVEISKELQYDTRPNYADACVFRKIIVIHCMICRLWEADRQYFPLLKRGAGGCPPLAGVTSLLSPSGGGAGGGFTSNPSQSPFTKGRLHSMLYRTGETHVLPDMSFRRNAVTEKSFSRPLRVYSG